MSTDSTPIDRRESAPSPARMSPASGPAAPVRVINGDSLTVLPTLPTASFDAVITDPPYLLRFRGEDWDTAPWASSCTAAFGLQDGAHRNPGAVLGTTRNPVCRRCHKHKRGTDCCACQEPDFDEAEHRIADMMRFAAWCEVWAAECLRVLKPGGHLLAFGGARTHHWLAVGIESAGFEVRDCIAWLKFGGFPKSTDLGKQFDRRAGAVRPVLSQHRVADIRGGNYLKSPGEPTRTTIHAVTAPVTAEAKHWTGWGSGIKPVWEPIIVARKPMGGNLIDNVAQHRTGAVNIDGCRIPWASGGGGGSFGGRNIGGRPGGSTYNGAYNQEYRTARDEGGRFPGNAITLEADAFWAPYTLVTPPGVSRKMGYGARQSYSDHPTQKPVPLMRWLCRLVTPPGGTVLDPFGGSGSTGVAAVAEGFGAVLIEIDPHYAAIARRRVAEAQGAPPPDEECHRGPRQVSLF